MNSRLDNLRNLRDDVLAEADELMELGGRSRTSKDLEKKRGERIRKDREERLAKLNDPDRKPDNAAIDRRRAERKAKKKREQDYKDDMARERSSAYLAHERLAKKKKEKGVLRRVKDAFRSKDEKDREFDSEKSKAYNELLKAKKDREAQRSGGGSNGIKKQSKPSSGGSKGLVDMSDDEIKAKYGKQAGWMLGKKRKLMATKK